MAEPGDCRHCKDYHDCTGKDYYSYADIRFCPYQVMWVLEHSGELESGDWPEQHLVTGYTDEPIKKKSTRTEGYFTKALRIRGEVENRLKRTGIHGKLLRAQVEAGYTFDQLDQDARDALMYVKGWQRKRMSFMAWKKQKKYYQKVVKVAT